MGWWSDVWEGAKDEASGIWEDIKNGDVGGLLESIGKGTLGFMTLGLSNKLSDLMDLPDVPQFMAEAEARKITHRSTIAPREVVYGQVKKGGVVAYIESSGTNDDYLHLIILLASHPCDSITAVYFDEVAVGTIGASDINDTQLFDIHEAYTGKVLMYAQLGAHTAVYSEILNNTPDSWTVDHKLLGQTFLYIRLQYDRALFDRGVPNISVEMWGKKDVYDPRDASTGLSRNHALCVLDYLRWEHGMNIPADEIDMASFENAADVSDESVDTLYQWWGGGLTESRYLVDGVLQVNKPPLRNLEELLRSAGAGMTLYQGKWRIIPAAYVAPTLSFDESDLVGGIQFSPSSGKAGRLNTVKGSYVGEDWQVTDYAQMQIAAYVANDLEVLTGTANYSLVGSGYRAQRLGKLAIERSRYGLTVNATFKFNALELSIGDRLSLSIAALGWSNKTFLVANISINFGAGVSLLLREDESAIYTWDTSDEVEIAQPPTVNLPDPNPILPTGLTIAEELYATNIVRDIKARALISWTDPGREQHYDVQYKASADSVWLWAQSGFAGLATTVEDIAPDIYDFRIRGLNSLGWSTDWVTETNVVIEGKTTPPPDVAALFLDGDILNWTYPSPPLDLLGFEVRIHHGDRQTWADATPLHVGVITASRFNVVGSTTGLKTFLVKALDTTGNYSVNPAIVVLGLGDPDINNVILTYDYEANTWPGTITNGVINGSNEIEADEVGAFYNSDGGSIFYDQVGTNLFYNSEFLKVTYAFEYTVDAADVNTQLTIDATVTAESYQIEYIPPSLGGTEYMPFPGYIPRAEEGLHKFRIFIPSQFGATVPKITALTLSLDVDDVVETFEDVSISSSGTRLSLTKTYRGIRNVSLTLQTDGSGATSLKLDDKNHTLGPKIYAYNSAGTAVNTTIDAQVRGY